MIPTLRRPARSSVLLLCSCLAFTPIPSRAAATLPSGLGPIRLLSSPARAGFSAAPGLATSPDGAVWLTWMEGTTTGRQLFRLSGYRAGRWTPPRTIAAGDSFFVNWADIPGTLPLPAGRFLTWWLWHTRLDPLAYGVRMAAVPASGPSGPIFRPHDDNSATPHGFASMAPLGDGGMLVWLDGRFSMPKPDSAADTQLRAAFVSRSGEVSREQVLDPRICDCCRTQLVAVPGGLLAAYRGRSADEVRDIRLVRYENGKWGQPYPLSDDGWTIQACPVNGPSLDARGERVAVAWLSSGRRPGVRVAFSHDAGRTFSTAVMVDSSGSLGRPRVLQLEDGSALVLWASRARRGAGSMARVVRVDANGRASAITEVGPMEGAVSGYPLMVRSGGSVLFAWTRQAMGGKESVELRQATLGVSRGASSAAR